MLDTALRVAAIASLVTGAIALLGPVGFGLDRFALQGSSVALIMVVSGMTLALEIVRMYRGRLRSETVGLLGVAGVVAAGIIGGLVGGAMIDQVIELGAPAAITLVLLGAGCSALSWRIRRTARTRPGETG